MSGEDEELRTRLRKERRKRKYREIKEFFDDEVPPAAKGQKTGKSAVGRFIIELAHERKEQLEEMKEEKVEGFARYENKLKELAEDV